MSELQSKKKKWEGYSSQRERLSKDTKTWGSLLCVWDYKESCGKREGQMSVQKTGHAGRAQFMALYMPG